ncbi:MAG: hypothetical protein J1E61_06385 [Lachnospiraceae bacterium]|nr:hypothetical protein [Lachnospiraceae bacterium]
MKKGLIKGIVCFVTFFISLFTISAVMNRGNTDTTMEMSEASYPLVYINYEGKHINSLHGYANEMDISYMRDTITPLGADRQISLYLEKYKNEITSLSFEVRSIDGDRLIENSQIYNYKEQDNFISADIILKDLIDADTEYEFILIVGTSGGRSIRYYTRIIQRSENHAGEEIRFINDFHEKTFDKEAARDLTMYLETDETGDNTTFSHVNIHSSFAQITWGNLDVEKISEPQIYVTELFRETMRAKVTYFVRVRTQNGERICRVEEFYRLRYGTQRIYLLDFDRTMNEVFEMELDAFNNNKLDLGIRNADVEIMESEDGGIFAFVSEGRLFCYNSSSNRFSQLFGFYGEGNEDERTYYDQNEIRILSVDETGNVQFLIYGYMNRGTHEGNMGVVVYFYNGALNTIEEEAFIPFDKSFAVLKEDMEQLTYLNNNNELFLYLNNTLFCIRLEENSYETVVENLPRGSLKVSKSNRMIVWPEGTDLARSTKLNLMNLNSRNVSLVEAGNGNYIRPLGFMEEDLIYGLIRSTDVYTDNVGSMLMPMFRVNIASGTDQSITMNYEKPGIYVSDISIESNQITLKRVRKDEGSGVYTSVEDDQIMSSEIELSGENAVEVVVAGDLEKIIQVAAKGNFVTKSLKFLTPKEVMYEGGHEVMLRYPEDDEDKYYVYASDGIEGVYSNVAEAVIYAESISGTVVGETGEYIWVRGNRRLQNQISKINGTMADENNSSLAVCLNTMLAVEGITRNSQYLLNHGETALSILQSQIPDGEVLDLSGCSLDAVLYYVDRDIPVMAMLNDRNAVLIIGFNELNTIIMDPSTGTIYRKGMNDSKEWFNQNGNQFIACFTER